MNRARPEPRLATVLLASMAAAAGCSAGGGLGDAVVRDSSGVRIVESAAAAAERSAGWAVAERPSLEIGSADGPGEYQLFRVTGVRRLSDGRAVVANAGTGELRYYDARGRHLHSAGGVGSGPGEFRTLTWIHRLPGDSVLAFDGELYRLSVFDAAGEFGRSFHFDGGEALVWPMVLFADGTVLAGTARPMGTRPTTGLERDSVLFLRFDLRGALLDTLGRFPFSERYVRVEGDRRTTIRRPFAREAQVAGAGAGFFVGTGDAYEFRLYSSAGDLRRVVRAALPARPVTAADRERHASGLLERVSDRWRDMYRQLYGELPWPETMPAHGDVLTDPDGRLWVEAYRGPGERASTWMVHDADGRMLGVVRLPPGLRLLEVGRDFVLGVHADELGVERVRLYGLSAPG